MLRAFSVCELLEERARFARELRRHGELLEEPIVSPAGFVVGTRVVLNPAERALHRIDQRLEKLETTLGLCAGGRLRLGVAELDLRQRAARLLEPIGGHHGRSA